MCHPLALTHVDVQAAIVPGGVRITSTVSTTGPTGVEMEALTAASIAALTVYDMTKALDKAIVIRDIRLESKSGGKSGDFSRRRNKREVRRSARHWVPHPKRALRVGSERTRIATRVDFTLDLERPGKPCAAPCGSGEMANTLALGASAQKACGFKSRLPHQDLTGMRVGRRPRTEL